MKRFFGGVLLLTASLVLAMLTWLPAREIRAQTPSPTFDINQVAAPIGPVAARSGRALYQENCAPCHGAQGQADGPAAANLPGPPTAFADANAVWERSPAELFYTAKFGRIEKLMPPWQNELSDDEIWRSVFYAWSLHTTQQLVEQGRALYGEQCAACHGDGGAGDGPEAVEPLPDFTDIRQTMTRSQADWLAGWQTAHAQLGAEWSTNDQAGVLEYIRTFSYIPIWESPYRPGNGVISGVVEQGTAGGQGVDGVEVTLDAFADFSAVASFTATVGADGLFEFHDLATDPTIVYFASATTGGVSYSSPVLTLTPEQTALATTIRIYETTDDPSGVTIDRLHWIIDSSPGALMVVQIIAFGSRADRAYIGEMVEGVDEPATVALTIPEGAVEISFENGELGDRFRQVGNRIYDTTPLVPGEGVKQIIMHYALPYAGTQANIDQEFLYPVTRLNVLVADLPDLAVTAPTLINVGTQDFQGSTYHIWQGENLEPEVVNIALSGLTERGEVDPRSFGEGVERSDATAAVVLTPEVPYAVGGFVVVVLVAAFIWAWQQGRTAGGESRQGLQRKRDAIIGEIARLDDRHALGELSDTAWSNQRAQLKAQLLSVAGKLEESSPPMRN